MKRLVIILLVMMTCLPFVYAEEETIIVQLEDGSIESRSVYDFVNMDEGIGVANVGGLADQAVQAAIATEGIVHAEKNQPIYLNASSPNSDDDSWRRDAIQLTPILNDIDTLMGSSTVKVAVLDSGLNYTGSDLNVAFPKDTSTTATDDFDVTSTSSHGTHVAGIVGAKIAGDDIIGVAPGVTIVPVKVFADNGSGDIYMLIRGLEYVKDLNGDADPNNDVDVLNMSLSYTMYSSIIENLLTDLKNQGVVLVAATGNDSNYWDGSSNYDYPRFGVSSGSTYVAEMDYPAAHDTVLAVGSLSNFNNTPVLSDYSNCSTTLGTLGYKSEVDVLAPGESIVSWITDSTTAYKSGTSMASPHVAGLAAIIKAKYPSFSVDQIFSIIRGTAVETGIVVPDPIQNGKTREDLIGQGLMNVYAAFDLNGIQSISIPESDDFNYDPTLDNFNCTVPFLTSEVTIDGEMLTGTTITANGNSIALGQKVALTSDSTSIQITSSYNGITKTKTIVVNKATPKLTGATFMVDSNTVDPGFDPAIPTQIFTFDGSQLKITFTAESSFIKIDNVQTSVYDAPMVTSGQSITIEVGSDNTFANKNSYQVIVNNDINSIRLSNIMFNGNNLTGFDPTTFEYDLGRLPYEQVFDFVPITMDPSSTVSYSLDGENYSSSITLDPLPETSEKLSIKVTSVHATDQVYSIEYIRDDGIDVTQLDVVKVATDASETTTNLTSINGSTVSVTDEIRHVRLEPTLENNNALVEYKINDGNYTGNSTLELKGGTNTVYVKVSMGMPSDADYTSQVYQFTVEMDPTEVVTMIHSAPAKSNNPFPYYNNYNFDAQVNSYTLKVSDTVENIMFEVHQLDPNADLTVTGSFDLTITETNGMITAKVMDTSVVNHKVTIKSSIGTEGSSNYKEVVYTYNIEVKDGLDLSDVNFENNGVPINIRFNNNKTTYDVPVVASPASITLSITKADESYGQVLLTYDANVETVYTSGSAITIDYQDPESVVLKVTTPIGESRTFNFNLNSRPLYTNNALAQLSATGISFTFDPNTTEYSGSVAHTVNSTVVSVTPNAQNAYALINGVAFETRTLSLQEGSNIISVLCFAEDGTSREYKINITKLAEPVPEPTPTPTPTPTPVPVPTPVDDKKEDTVEEIKTDDGKTKAVVNVSKDRVEEAIDDEEKDVVNVDAKEQVIADVNLEKDILELVKDSEKVLEVAFDDVVFQLSTEVIEGLNIKESLNVTFEKIEPIDEIEEVEVEKVVSDIFDLDIKDGDRSVKFDEPIPIVLDYNPENVEVEENIAVYYYDEYLKEWLYAGGKVLESGQIQFRARHFTKYAIRETSIDFEDIETHWAKPSIEAIASKEISKGVNDSTYAPDKSLTNAEFIVMLVKILGLEAYEGNVPYVNVEDFMWYTPFVKNAFNANLLVNTYLIDFDPNQEITREEMASLLMTTYYYYSDLEPGELLITGEVFADDEDEVTSYFRKSVREAYQLQLIVGDTQNRFNPKSGATRAEAAVVIRKLMEILDLL